jgi:hypothetical protein
MKINKRTPHLRLPRLCHTVYVILALFMYHLFRTVLREMVELVITVLHLTAQDFSASRTAAT